jgi:hypothetical protein
MVTASESHLDDEQLALHALGEPLPATAVEHLQGCDRCTAEIDQLSAVVATARTLGENDQPRSPDPRVWARIKEDLDLGTGTVAPVADVGQPVAEVASIADRRHRWPTGLLVAASVLGLVAGATVALGASALVDDGTTPAPVASVVATTSLAALPDHAGTGRAEIVETPSGKELVVDVSDLTETDGFYEVWLIDPQTSQMIGLGALSGDNGRFAIPEGLDLTRYRLVDVSSEPLDGDPVHSTDSVVRGELTV